MGLPVPDGIYYCQLPNTNECISDPGEGRYLHILPRDHSQAAHQIEVQYNPMRGGYTIRFIASGKFWSWIDELVPNTKLVPQDKPQYFTITPHEYYPDQFIIGIKEDKEYHVGMAHEIIYPPWVALHNSPAKQPWHFRGAHSD